MKKPYQPEVRNPYNYDREQAGNDSGLKCEDQHLAKQEFKKESDINFIAERFGLTGEIPEVLQLPQYGDFSGIYDFQTAQNTVIEARRQFMTLPAKMRDRFANDPQKLLEFLDNPDNRDEAQFLGLVKKPDVAPQSPVGDLAAPDRANPAPDPDKPSEPPTTKDKKTKN